MTAPPPDSTVAWAPEDLALSADELAGLSYVVVEDMVDQLALLRRWPWPRVDPLGRLIWHDGSEYDSDAAAVEVPLLRAQLYTPNGLRRHPRCGDTFAAAGSVEVRWHTVTEVTDLRELFSGALYDISADAREAAKIAYQAGLGAVRPPRAVDEQVRVAQAVTLRARASRPLRALTIAEPPQERR